MMAVVGLSVKLNFLRQLWSCMQHTYQSMGISEVKHTSDKVLLMNLRFLQSKVEQRITEDNYTGG
jgi:hypothetical protein